MPLRFTKMHGLGNDYVYISTFDQHVVAPDELARVVSDRHRGVGSDGLILVTPPDGRGADCGPLPSGDAHVRMIMFNADGSRAQMCGNGIRCVAKYAFEHGLARHNPLRVATDRGVLTLELTLGPTGHVSEVRVDMGEPILEPARIPVAVAGARAVNVLLGEIEHIRTQARRHEGTERDAVAPAGLRFTAVSMGNPHAVFFVVDLASVPLKEWGPALERHALFPERINVHFVQVARPDYLKMVTWERGAGPTQACGTGAAAVCVAGVLNGVSARHITALLPGGVLKLEWDERTNHVFKTGPATEVFSGEWPA